MTRELSATGQIVLTLILVLLIAGVAFAEETEKGVYRVGIDEEPTTLNFWAAMGPSESTIFDFIVQMGYYTSLYGFTEPTWAFVPTLAKDLPGPILPEEPYYTSTIELQRGLYWSAGIPFTAEDVVFTYTTLIDLGLGGNWQNFHPKSLVKVEKVDEYKVKFYFRDEPSLAEWYYGVLICPIMPVAQWGLVVEKAKNQADPAEYLYTYEITDPVTLAGFDLEKWESGGAWQNHRADYHTPDGEIRIYENGRVEMKSLGWSWGGMAEPGSLLVQTLEMGPHVDSVLYKFYPDQDSLVMALRKGEIDYILSREGLTKEHRRQLRKAEGVRVVANPSNSWNYLAFNRERYPFQITQFHQAAATLIDREFVTEQVLHAAALPTSTVVPGSNRFWHNPQVPGYGEGMSRSERIQEAVRLLEEGGFSWEIRPTVDVATDSFTPGKQIILPNGQVMEEFVIMTPARSDDPMQAIFGQYIQYWLQDLGIPAVAQATPFEEMSRSVFDEMDFDAYILSWNLGGTYPDYLYQFFATHGGFNVNGYSDPLFDEVIQEFRGSRNLEEARKLAWQAQAQLAETLPYIVLYTNPVYDAYRSDRVEYPFTESLEGIQGLYGMPGMVKMLSDDPVEVEEKQVDRLNGRFDLK